MRLAVVRDMRETRVPAGAEEAAALETDVLAGFVLARAAAGLCDSTISGDVSNLEQVRAWFGRPLWEMTPADADMYFGKVMRAAAANTRLKRAQAGKTWFAFLELRHKAEICQLTGHVAECPLDEVNRAAGRRCGSRRRPGRSRSCSRAAATNAR
jgi:hypothetical protein